MLITYIIKLTLRYIKRSPKSATASLLYSELVAVLAVLASLVVLDDVLLSVVDSLSLLVVELDTLLEESADGVVSLALEVVVEADELLEAGSVTLELVSD